MIPGQATEDKPTGSAYVHGYSGREGERLCDQAGTLAEILHHDTFFPAGSRVLEAGCGVGAQTVIIAAQSPDADFTSIDISPVSLEIARESAQKHGLQNVRFRQADIFHLPFEDCSFDHVFVCFVLEHLNAPVAALTELKRVLKKGGSITVIEGDHGSCFFHPHSDAAMRTIDCLIRAQAQMGGDSLIGRRIYPLLVEAGYCEPQVGARMVYVDSSRPGLVEGFTKNTITAMVEGVRGQAIESGMIEPDTWDRGIADLYRTAEQDGTFCYTFFKGVALK